MVFENNVVPMTTNTGNCLLKLYTEKDFPKAVTFFDMLFESGLLDLDSVDIMLVGCKEKSNEQLIATIKEKIRNLDFSK
jgi:hypothetical protein